MSDAGPPQGARPPGGERRAAPQGGQRTSDAPGSAAAMSAHYRRLRVCVAAGGLLLALSGCATLSQYIPTIPAPSLRWLYDAKKPGPLPELKASASAATNWQLPVGRAGPGFAPAVLTDAIYVAASDGSLTRIDPANGRVVWRITAGRALSAGVGADASVVVVGTDKGAVLAFVAAGHPKWTARASTEIVAPPRVADGIVTVFAGDGSVHAFAAEDGAKKWVNQRVAPALTVRNYAGGVDTRGGLFVGTAGGRLLAIDVVTGIVGWDGTVANPKGATELERIADVTGLPLIDGRQVCAVAYQGRLACFEVTKGALNWSRDVSSLYNLAADANHLYVTDERGALHALDKQTGASVWKQDLLAARKIGAPQIVGDLVGVTDAGGYLHLFSPINGAYVGRLATDGTAATAQPQRLLGSVLWQSAGGNLYAVSAK